MRTASRLATSTAARVAVTTFGVAFAARWLTILRLTPMPSGDGYDRLAHTDRLVVHDWLPLYQALLNALALVSRSPDWLRGGNAAVGALAAAAFGLLVTAELGAAAGLVVGLGVALSPVHGLTAAGLYQEPLFVLLVCGALAALAHRPALAAALIAAASLTRYEGWLLALIGAVWLSFAPPPARRSRGAALALGVVPAAWLAWRLWGSGPAFGGWLAPSSSLDRWLEQAHILLRLLPYWVGWPAMALAGVGAGLLLHDLWRGRRPGVATRGLLLLGAADLVFVTTLRPFSPPDNSRQLHLPVLVLSLLAARVVGLAPEGRWRWAAAALVAIALSGPPLRGWLESEPDPLVRRAYAAAAMLPPLGGDDAVLVLDPGAERYPGGIPSACATVLAYARLPRDRVWCDADVPSLPPGELRPWLLARHIQAVVWPDPSAVELPVHRLVQAAWEEGALQDPERPAARRSEGDGPGAPTDPVVLTVRP